MGTTPYSISRPGWTGNRAQRIVQAAPRTLSSVDPLSHPSVAWAPCPAVRSLWRLALRTPLPVSVTPRDTETGNNNLAQCQSPWTSAASEPRCKSPDIRRCGGLFSLDETTTAWSVPDAKSGVRGRLSVSGSLQSEPLVLLPFGSAARSGVIDRAHSVLHPNQNLAIEGPSDRQNGCPGYRSSCSSNSSGETLMR